MKVWIPQCGDAARLDAPWSFTLVLSHTNLAMLDAVRGRKRKHPATTQVTLPAGCELVFDRVYVRQGKDDTASVTFIVKQHPSPALVGGRFWASLDEVNRIEATPTSSGNPVGGLAPQRYRADIDAPPGSPKAARIEASRGKRASLAAARTAARAAFADETHVKHVASVLDKVLDERYGSLSGIQYPLRQEHRDVLARSIIEAGDPPTRGQPRLYVAATRRTPEGDLERDFSVQFDDCNTMFPCFRVTSRGADVTGVCGLECRPWQP